MRKVAGASRFCLGHLGFLSAGGKLFSWQIGVVLIFWFIFLKLALIGSRDTRIESSKSILELSSEETVQQHPWERWQGPLDFVYRSFCFLSAGGKLFSWQIGFVLFYVIFFWNWPCAAFDTCKPFSHLRTIQIDLVKILTSMPGHSSSISLQWTDFKHADFEKIPYPFPRSPRLNNNRGSNFIKSKTERQ